MYIYITNEDLMHVVENNVYSCLLNGSFSTPQNSSEVYVIFAIFVFFLYFIEKHVGLWILFSGSLNDKWYV